MQESLTTWPPDYAAIFLERLERLKRLMADPKLAQAAWIHYSNNPIDFINHWCVTYDPRNATSDTPTTMPFILFPKQEELVQFFMACLDGEADGLIEKARDMGVTWTAGAFSVWLWIFRAGASAGWGSRKEGLVDKLGDPDSIFEKMRVILNNLPKKLFWPVGFTPKDHMTYMKIINPENGSTITGEAGDNIGRGGRKLIYFKDESAHYERPEKIEASLADNTNCQIDISSVNGTANIFYRKRESGVEWKPGGGVTNTASNIFTMDWSDHPAKTQEWYYTRKAKAEASGMLHIFAQEVDRDYSASVEGVIIRPEWIRAAIDAHIKLGFGEDGGWGAGLDIADGGVDKNAYVDKKGVVLKSCYIWTAPDVGVSAGKAIDYASGKPDIEVQYDCIGVGAGVKSEVNRLEREGVSIPSFTPWNAGAAVLMPDERVNPKDPESPKNKEYYENIKAQAWGETAQRFWRTYQAVVQGVEHDSEQLISISSEIDNLQTLVRELAQATWGKSAKHKRKVNKAPSGTKSPNSADAVIQCYWPIPSANHDGPMGWVF